MQKAGYTGKVKIGMDVAASEFYTEDKKYDLDFKTENNDKSKVITGYASGALCLAAPAASLVSECKATHWGACSCV